MRRGATQGSSIITGDAPAYPDALAPADAGYAPPATGCRTCNHDPSLPQYPHRTRIRADIERAGEPLKAPG